MKKFLDTNLLVYAHDPRFPQKRARAVEIVSRAIDDGSGVISTQVMQEYAVTASSKLHQDADDIFRQLLLLESFEVVQVTPALIRRGLELQFRYGINYWDASILAAAEYAQCELLLTEDLNPGQLYATIRIENPFASL
jgi:predicted nucleic acid-binding protein